MNRTLLPTIASAILAIQAISAQVPSLINYQGRLTDSNGAPVTGSKNFGVSIYDAPTNGNLLYSETIGAVTLDANGVYSFQFGGSGTSNTLAIETVATADGTTTTFQKVLANSPVVAGSVSVTDGTYTWSQAAGSSNEGDFGVAYSTSLRRVTVNYYNGAPAAGLGITATYRYGKGGITGALSSGAEHWMAISVDGTVQGTRQRVLAVPFAMNAARATTADSITKTRKAATLSFFNIASKSGSNTPTDTASVRLPVSLSGANYAGGWSGGLACSKPVESSINTILSLSAETSISSGTAQYPPVCVIELVSYAKDGVRTIIASQSTNSSGKIQLSGPFYLNHSENEYLVEIGMSSPGANPPINVTIKPVIIEYE